MRVAANVRRSLLAAGQVPRLQHDSPTPLANGHKNLNVQAGGELRDTGLFAGSSATAPAAECASRFQAGRAATVGKTPALVPGDGAYTIARRGRTETAIIIRSGKPGDDFPITGISVDNRKVNLGIFIILARCPTHCTCFT